MKTLLTGLAMLAVGAAAALAPRTPALAQVRISSLPPATTLTGTELIPAVQAGADVTITPGQIQTFASGGGGATPGPGTFSSLTDTGIIGGVQQCAALSSGGQLIGSGIACLVPGGVTGNIQYNNGAGGLAGGALTGDCTSATLTLTCTKTNGVAFGTAASQNIGTSGLAIPLLNGANTWSGNPNTFAQPVVFANTLKVSSQTLGSGGHLLSSNIAPAIASGFGTSPSVAANNNTSAFTINVGAGGTASTGVVGLAAAATGWACSVGDLTTTSSTVFITKEIATTASSVTVGNFTSSAAAAPWAASDVLQFQCTAY